MYNYGLGDIAGKRAASAGKVLAYKSAHVGSVPGNHMSDFHTRDEVHILTSRDWAQKDWTRYNCSNWESTEAVFACTQTVNSETRVEERLMGPHLFLAKPLEKGDIVFSCVPMGEPTRLHWIIQIYTQTDVPC